MADDNEYNHRKRQYKHLKNKLNKDYDGERPPTGITTYETIGNSETEDKAWDDSVSTLRGRIAQYKHALTAFEDEILSEYVSNPENLDQEIDVLNYMRDEIEDTLEQLDEEDHKRYEIEKKRYSRAQDKREALNDKILELINNEE